MENNVYLVHQLLYIGGYGHVLALYIEGKDIPQEKIIPQHFLLSGVN